MSDAFNELIAHADSVLKTLDKDYEAMQLQKSGVKEDHAKVLDTLICNMRGILAEYEPVILDFSNKIPESHYNTWSKCYEVFRTDKYIYYYVANVYWIKGEVYFMLTVRYAHNKPGSLDGTGHYINYSNLYISMEETNYQEEFKIESMADFVSVFLNHVPSYEQLKLVFEEAVTEYVKTVMHKIQDRNERLANKIKEVTK